MISANNTKKSSGNRLPVVVVSSRGEEVEDDDRGTVPPVEQQQQQLATTTAAAEDDDDDEGGLSSSIYQKSTERNSSPIIIGTDDSHNLAISSMEEGLQLVVVDDHPSDEPQQNKNNSGPAPRQQPLQNSRDRSFGSKRKSAKHHRITPPSAQYRPFTSTSSPGVIVVWTNKGVRRRKTVTDQQNRIPLTTKMGLRRSPRAATVNTTTTTTTTTPTISKRGLHRWSRKDNSGTAAVVNASSSSPQPSCPTSNRHKGLHRLGDLTHQEMISRLHSSSPQQQPQVLSSNLGRPTSTRNKGLHSLCDLNQQEIISHLHSFAPQQQPQVLSSSLGHPMSQEEEIDDGDDFPSNFIYHDPGAEINVGIEEEDEEDDDEDEIPDLDGPDHHGILVDMESSRRPSATQGTIGTQDAESHPSPDHHEGHVQTAPTTSSPHTSQQDDLVQAVPVQPNEVLVTGEAEMVDPEQIERDQIRLQKARECRRCGMWIIAIALATLTLSLIFGGDDPRIVTAPPIPSPANNVSTFTTEAPSATMTALALLADLPNSTLDLIQYQPMSAQARALDWVEEYTNATKLPPWRQLQLFALATYYYSFDGENWQNRIQDDWMGPDKHECFWYSLRFVTSDIEAARNYAEYTPRGSDDANASICNIQFQYEYLELTGVQGIRGTVPPEIQLLPNLRGLGIRSSDLTAPLSSLLPSEILLLSDLRSIDFLWNFNVHGTIPDLLGSLSSLEGFSISRNKISGLIPSAMGRATRLRHLFMENNSLVGPIPSEIAGLQNLTVVYLSKNSLNGSLPTFPNSSRMAILDARDNLLSGTIPQEVFSSMSGLLKLDLGFNQLTGNIPTNPSSPLELLDLSSNSLTGSIPATLGLMSQLTSLYLQDNFLSNSIPEQLFHLTNLTWLNLEWNLLAGTLSSSIGLLPNLTWLILNSNSLGGGIPSEIALLDKMEQFVAIDNSFSGTIPEDIWRLPHLTDVYLEDNLLSGSISSEIALAGNNMLTSLYLGGNRLVGRLPSQLFALTKLETLSLERNIFSTQLLPTEFGQLTRLNYHLFLQESSFLGPIPSELGLLSSVLWLKLGSNRLNLTVPTELGSMSNMIVLDLKNNTISGDLPTELGQLKELRKLYLNDNPAINGTIPSELGQLTKLQGLHLHRTALSGEVPLVICRLPSLRKLLINCSLVKCWCCECG